jgi:conserved oligomeric Golgi complex subunit 6
LERFTLNSDDIDAIVSRDIPVNKHFFAAMDKAERIQDDCRVLMAGEEGPTKAGYAGAIQRHMLRSNTGTILMVRIDILTTTSGYLEQAYDKIFRWCSFEFRQMGRDAQVEVNPSMREAVRRLRKRSELLSYVA